MAGYYVNRTAQANGDHEVHRDGCYWLGLVINPEYLGDHFTCYPAVTEARRRGYHANGCAHCSPACHTS